MFKKFLFTHASLKANNRNIKCVPVFVCVLSIVRLHHSNSISHVVCGWKEKKKDSKGIFLFFASWENSTEYIQEGYKRDFLGASASVLSYTQSHTFALLSGGLCPEQMGEKLEKLNHWKHLRRLMVLLWPGVDLQKSRNKNQLIAALIFCLSEKWSEMVAALSKWIFIDLWLIKNIPKR